MAQPLNPQKFAGSLRLRSLTRLRLGIAHAPLGRRTLLSPHCALIFHRLYCPLPLFPQTDGLNLLAAFCGLVAVYLESRQLFSCSILLGFS